MDDSSFRTAREQYMGLHGKAWLWEVRLVTTREEAGRWRCPAQVWHMDRPAEMLVLPLEAELPPNAIVRVNQPGSLVRT